MLVLGRKWSTKAPIQDLRFDDSLYHFLGEGLVDLTQESETIINTCTYEQRSVGGYVFRAF